MRASSPALLLLEALAFWLVMLGSSIHLGFGVGLAVFLMVRLGTAIPNAPGNIGAYQFFTVLGLALFGVDKAVAAGFSLIVFVLLTLLILGFIAISHSGTSLMQLRRTAQNLANRSCL